MKLLALTSKNLFNLFISIYMINSNICLHISCKDFYHKSYHFYSLCVKISTILTNKTAYRFWYLIYHLISHQEMSSFDLPWIAFLKKKTYILHLFTFSEMTSLSSSMTDYTRSIMTKWPLFSLLWSLHPRKLQLQCKGMSF